MKGRITENARVRTNALYAQRISPVPLEGTVLGRYACIAGCWVVRMDGHAAPQRVHEKFLEVTQ